MDRIAAERLVHHRNKITKRKGFIMEQEQIVDFVKSFNAVQRAVHANALKHGWWEDGREDGTVIALMHSELSEALEAMRKGNPPDAHCPEFDSVTVELADCIIRIMDYAGRNNLPVASAVIRKHQHNVDRPYKHGGKKF